MQQVFERIFDRLYVGYGIHFKSREIIILFSVCRYAQFCAFISVIELPRIPAYCPKNFSQNCFAFSSLLIICNNVLPSTSISTNLRAIVYKFIFEIKKVSNSFLVDTFFIINNKIM